MVLGGCRSFLLLVTTLSGDEGTLLWPLKVSSNKIENKIKPIITELMINIVEGLYSCNEPFYNFVV